MLNIGVLGTGTWGIALTKVLVDLGYNITMWSAIPDEIKELSLSRRHKNLPNMEIPKNVIFTDSIEKVIINKDIIICAVPSIYVRSTIKKAKRFISKDQIIVSVAKGIEASTLYTMTQVIESEIPYAKVVALSGPTHAEEVAESIPTTIVAACKDLKVAMKIQDVFMSKYMRVYTNTDILGVELSGALKNIIAIASGISSGLGWGDNTRAAIITRGLYEIKALGQKMGCFEETFSGLSGIGDLVVTAISENSRNNRYGFFIGRGMDSTEALERVGMVVEGLNVLPAALELEKKYCVEMPLVDAVEEIVNKGASPIKIAEKLMTREKKNELFSYSNINRSKIRIKQKEKSYMKRVITYGTFDLLHYGHINLVKRAKALGDYLIVAISTDEFNWNEKHKKTYFTYEQRKQLLEALRYVDLVIPEENWQQKKTDMHEYHIDTFVMGDDWKGKFDFLRAEGVDVVYLPRTPEISTSQIKRDLYDANDAIETELIHDEINTNPNK